MRPDSGQEGSSRGASVVRPTCSEPHHCSSTSSIRTCSGTETGGGGGVRGGAEINSRTVFPVSYLKQLVRFQLLGAEHDSVGVAPNPAGLAAITQQHHVFAVFTVEPMGNTCNYKQKKKLLTTAETGAFNGTLLMTDLATGSENSSP